MEVWLLEFENELESPTKEIGLDKFDSPEIIMPWKENCGYWTDNNLSYQGFVLRFKSEPLDGSFFETKWNQYSLKN